MAKILIAKLLFEACLKSLDENRSPGIGRVPLGGQVAVSPFLIVQKLVDGSELTVGVALYRDVMERDYQVDILQACE